MSPDAGPAGRPAEVDALDALPHVALDPDGLDLLELALGGALPALPPLPGVPAGGDAVLTDAERTPLARVRADGSLETLRPFGHHAGPPWDPDLRRRPSAVRAQLRGPVSSGSVLAVVVDDLPTRGDIEAIRDRVAAAAPAAVLVAVPVARRRRPAGAVGWPALVRVARALAGELAGGPPARPVEVVVVPWPTGAPAAAGHDDAAVLAAYGADAAVAVGELRAEADAERVAGLGTVFEQAVRELYPPAAAVEILAAARAGRRPGALVLLTGLSGSGKSTIARALVEDLLDGGTRGVTLLDGDEVRQHLSSELGFDAASRETNIRRIAWVGALVAEHGGVAVAAPIAPFASSRRYARDLLDTRGAFVLVHISTPLEVCEARDRKGLYARARAGLLPDFTGISSPYEVPDDADVVVDTTTVDVDEAVRRVRAVLDERLGDGPAAAG